MTPAVETAKDIAGLQVINSLLVGLSLALAGLFWFVDSLREKGCAHCAHCQARNRAAAALQAERDAALRERLFGRAVVEPPEEGPSGGSVDDEGLPDDEAERPE